MSLPIAPSQAWYLVVSLTVCGAAIVRALRGGRFAPATDAAPTTSPKKGG